MRRIFCDCCEKEIFEMQNIYSMEIKRGNDLEIIVRDMCESCYQQIIWVVDHKR